MVSASILLVRFVRGCSNRTKDMNPEEVYSENVSEQDEKYVEGSISVNDQNKHVAAQGPICLVSGMKSNQDFAEEDKKEDED